MKPVVICVKPSQARYVQAAVGAATQMNVAERIAEAKRLTIPLLETLQSTSLPYGWIEANGSGGSRKSSDTKGQKPRGRSDESE
ncbi:hypothetical protein CU102_03300 [Phyllobacterium brassicacearum]|uniref:Uncharacterized protein n=1 Tax=Phyllobacterium brassicacearum TaxID=314235 RepID=A0A2P7BUI7_9HYPH|nr:hypothetical protein CU102_03300 [Phyllobacterium brassicacearum]TDQ33991.1 hypothetical protein DEV91_104194 [Phyllobacterium brassicacearum]